MWDQIRSNQRRSVVVITAMGVLLVALGVALGGAVSPTPGGLYFGGLIALGLWLVMWLVTMAKGDDIMLRMAKARQIQKQDHPTLVNVVEEMTIASTLGHRPRIFIVDDPAPNAFATGRDPKKASVAVTTGLLDILDREELQGVVAHEIGHIKNRDVALMTTAGIMLGCIVLLSEIGFRVLLYGGGGRRRSSRSGDGGGQAVMMILAIVLMILAPIFAQMIYFALSRRREYLADASGAMFTRYPEGLASALEKLAGSHKPQADKSKVTAPMYIMEPLRAHGMAARGRSRGSMFSTHPPIDKRVKVLRSMAGGSGYKDYEKAFRRVVGSKAIGERTLSEAKDVPIEAPAAVDATPRHDRVRQASDAFLAASGYQRRACPGCGATLKLPPSLSKQSLRCPRCNATV